MKNIINKFNKKRFLACFVLIFVLLSLTFTTGCEYFTQQSTSTDDVQKNEPKDFVKEMTDKMKAAGYSEMKLTANFYYQSCHLDSITKLHIEFVDDYVSIKGYIYDDISYESDYKDLKFDEDGLLNYAQYADPEVYELLQKIQNTKFCYVLKTDAKSGYGLKIAVYEVDGAYYFLSSFEADEVMRIYKAVI